MAIVAQEEGRRGQSSKGCECIESRFMTDDSGAIP